MNRTKTRIVVEKVRQVHRALADVITTMDLLIEVSDSLSQTEKAQYERYWKEAQLKAIEDLRESLNYLSHAQISPPLKSVSR